MAWTCPVCHVELKSQGSHVGSKKCDQNQRRQPPQNNTSGAAPTPPATDKPFRPSKERIMRRIPHGAREAARESFRSVLQAVATSASAEAWGEIQSFAPKTFRLPNQPKSGPKRSLASIVKQNIAQSAHDTDRPPDVPQNRKARDPDRDLIRRVGVKIDDGDVSGAMRVLCSTDSVVEPTDDVLQELREKHPQSPPPQLPPAEDQHAAATPISPTEVFDTIRRFPRGSAAGPDGLRPQHLLDMVGPKLDARSLPLCEALATVLNLVLHGKIPAEVRCWFFGGRLLALRKKDGGLRPIAVGCSMRRLIAKIICYRVADRMCTALAPHQLGFSVRGGAEAIVHATRRFLECDPGETKVLLKVDFRNAFNTVSRTAILQTVKEQLPEYWDYFVSCYGDHSDLFVDELLLTSEAGVQQGDPLGPLLVCLVVKQVVAEISCPLNAWYLDDGTLGGNAVDVLYNFQNLVRSAHSIGLTVNEAKCEIFVAGGDVQTQEESIELFREHFPAIRVTSKESLTLLGAPVLDESIGPFMTEKAAALSVTAERLKLLPSHQGLFLLRHCLGVPKVVYALRCCNAWKCPEKLYALDEVMRHCFQDICNVRTKQVLDYTCWRQATLPVSRGGIGIRRAEELALPAFLASIHSTSDLVADLLPTLVAVDLSNQLDIWKGKSNQAELPPTALRGSQRIWDTPLCNVSLSVLMAVFQDSEVHTARLLGASRPESGLWLNALPSAHIGNLLNDDTLKIAVGLRIGAEICKPHECFKCRKEVTSHGHHGLSCRFAAGTHARHGGLNNIVCRALVSANIPSKLEPRGTFHTTGQRPDGYTTFAWKRGLCLAWDVTCVDTVCQSHVKSTATAPASAAEQAEKKKRRLYSYLEGRYMFEPLGFETFGAWGSAAVSLIKEIAKRLKENTGEPRSHEYLRQRLSLEIQRAVASAPLPTDYVANTM